VLLVVMLMQPWPTPLLLLLLRRRRRAPSWRGAGKERVQVHLGRALQRLLLLRRRRLRLLGRLRWLHLRPR
jgi:hypothetical protein